MKYSRLSKCKIKIIECFSLEITATDTIQLLGLNRKTINNYFNAFRENILEQSLIEQKKELGEYELDESYLGAKRVRGKRGRGAAEKNACILIVKTQWESVCDSCSKLFSRRVNAYNTRKNFRRKLNSYRWLRAYDGLILNGYNHYRVHHSYNEFARGKCHVNGIECFWSFAKRRFAKFNGMNNDKFILHLNESECLFSYKGKDFTSFINKIFFNK